MTPHQTCCGDPLSTIHPVGVRIKSLLNECYVDPEWILKISQDNEDQWNAVFRTKNSDEGMMERSFGGVILDNRESAYMYQTEWGAASPVLNEEHPITCPPDSSEDEEGGDKFRLKRSGGTSECWGISENCWVDSRSHRVTLVRREEYEHQSLTWQALACRWGEHSTYLRTADQSQIIVQIFNNPDTGSSPIFELLDPLYDPRSDTVDKFKSSKPQYKYVMSEKGSTPELDSTLQYDGVHKLDSEEGVFSLDI
ncbi:hypothetical protein M231_05610 [Tremella mesenterica]|uniref:Uncharacterized protein n=1 Tax=Tremella mesenterica TaxID=5217 RepID=A0A4Q1BHR4_TREME|nr:hypothetical protein M231_05610 [Tremella mesenterica]